MILLNRRNIMECTFMLTNNCNFSCSYCYEKNKKKEDMSLDTIRNAVDYIANSMPQNDTAMITFLGGEPLMNLDGITNIIREFENKNINVKYFLTTNGSLISDEFLDLSQKNRINISLSIDGDYNTQCMNRKGCSRKIYDRILSVAQTMAKENMLSKIRMTVSANNIQDLSSNIIYFYEMGLKRISLGFDYFTIWNDEQIKSLETEVGNIAAFYLDHCEDKDFFMNIFDEKFISLITYRTPLFCNAGSSRHFAINCDGYIYPCTYVNGNKKWCVGHVDDKVDKSKILNMIRRSISLPCRCDSCAIRCQCIGCRCGFMNYSLTGFLNMPNNIECTTEKILYDNQLTVLKKLYDNQCYRIINLLEIAKKHNVLLNSEIMQSVSYVYN